MTMLWSNHVTAWVALLLKQFSPEGNGFRLLLNQLDGLSELEKLQALQLNFKLMLEELETKGVLNDPRIRRAVVDITTADWLQILREWENGDYFK